MCTFTIMVCINLPSLRGINSRSPHHTSPRRGGLRISIVIVIQPLPTGEGLGRGFEVERGWAS